MPEAATTIATAAAARRPGRPRPKVWRDKHWRWVQNGDGTVSKRAYWKRHRRRPRRKHPRGPGPRPLPRPQSPEAPKAGQRFGVYSGPFGRLEATRLLNRAGFGPAPGQAERLAKLGLRKAVLSLTRPSGAATLRGPAPVDGDGEAIAPADAWGHDHLWWLDRMVRSDQSLVERMALIFHDWFATSNDKVSKQQQMIDQSNLFRARWGGSFLDLLKAVTIDPAMLQWLDGTENTRRSPNENYAREVMELFTLGADRGAYTETDIREAARAFTGWRNDWSEELGAYNFRFDTRRHDANPKTIFGQTGAFGWEDACRLCVQHPLHPSFLVEKLWSYFVPTPPSADTSRELQRIYRTNGWAIRPVVEAILMHPDLYLGAPMVKAPVVYLASLLRRLGRGIDTEDWAWLCGQAGQMLFWPPNVSGWDDDRWLDTSTIRARWMLVTYALEDRYMEAWDDSYSTTETPTEALNNALSSWGWPALRAEHQNELLSLSRRVGARATEEWQQSPYRALRQNALRQLIAISPDLQLG